MNQAMDLRQGITLGVLAGVIWGALALIASFFTRTFDFDFGVFPNLPLFLIGGAGFGLVLGAFFEMTKDRIPFEGIIRKTVALSVGIWLTFFSGGVFLHFTKPDRYHLDALQSLNGFLMSVLLGLILGVIWKKREERK